MMGFSHALTGAAGWIAITASAPIITTGIYPLGAVGVFTGAVVCAGAALLPDADHQNGTIAHSVPLVGEMVTTAIGDISGGHRKGLHSLLAAILVLALSSGLGFITVDTEWFGTIPLGAGIATMALVAFATRALKIARRSWLGPWFLGFLVAAGIVLLAPGEISWLPIAITVGFIIHLVGDALTTDGVPLFWPLKPQPPYWFQGAPILGRVWKRNGYFAVPVLGNAGSGREWLFGIVLMLYIACAFVYEGFWAFGLDIISLL